MLFALSAVALAGCSGTPASMDVSRTPDAPTVYRVSTEAESRFSGPVSDLKGGTKLTAAFEATPVSDTEVEVVVLYLAASVRNSEREYVALDLEPLSGTKAGITMQPPGEVSRVRGDAALLDAAIPLISMRGVISALFPPLPQEELQEGDTWTGDIPVPFGNLGDPEQRMRYLLDGIDSSNSEARIEGYELSTEPRAFESETASSRVTGEGDLDVVFEGELHPGEGYEWTERSAEFDSRFIRLAGSGYANGSLHMESKTTVERLNAAEQFGFDPDSGR
jgi:hypothetical protein